MIAGIVLCLLMFVAYLFLGFPVKEDFGLSNNQLAFTGAIQYSDSAKAKELDTEKEFFGNYVGNAGIGSSIYFQINKSVNENCKAVWDVTGFSRCSLLDLELNSNLDLIKKQSDEILVKKGKYILSCMTSYNTVESSQEEECF